MMVLMSALPRWILLIGLAFVFGYFGVDKFLNPLTWIGWIPPWLDGVFGFDREMWLSIFGAVEIALAVGLLLPLYTVQRIAAAGCGIHLIGVISQVGWNDVAVRDIGLIAIAAALVATTEEQ